MDEMVRADVRRLSDMQGCRFIVNFDSGDTSSGKVSVCLAT